MLTKRAVVIALLAVPLAALLGLSRAWCDAGDDAFKALGSNNKHAFELAEPAAKKGNFLAEYIVLKGACR